LVQIRLENISKAFPQSFGKPRPALEELSLEIKDGSFTAIIGTPGSGKSTLLKIIAGIIEPDKGKIFFDGRDVTDIPVQERNVAFVFQTYAIYPNMTMHDNIAFPLRKMKMSKEDIERVVREVAESLKIAHVLDRYARECSGGERQRVAIARCMVRKPKVYLFDEPLTNVDYKVRESMRSEFRKMFEEQAMTIVYATPNSLEALAMSEEVAVLRDGRLEQCGATGAVSSRPKDTYVAEQLSYPPMNTFHANLVETAGKAYFRIVGVDVAADHLRNLFEEKDVIVGIRVNRIRIIKESAQSSLNLLTVPAEVMLSEIVGSETLVHFKCSDCTLRVNLPELTSYDYGDNVTLGMDPKDFYFFDKRGQFISRYGDNHG